MLSHRRLCRTPGLIGAGVWGCALREMRGWETGRAASSGRQRSQTEYAAVKEWPVRVRMCVCVCACVSLCVSVCSETALPCHLPAGPGLPFREKLGACWLWLVSSPVPPVRAELLFPALGLQVFAVSERKQGLWVSRSLKNGHWSLAQS